MDTKNKSAHEAGLEIQSVRRTPGWSGAAIDHDIGHVFGNVMVSDHARVVLGNVYEGCPDLMKDFTLSQKRTGRSP